MTFHYCYSVTIDTIEGFYGERKVYFYFVTAENQQKAQLLAARHAVPDEFSIDPDDYEGDVEWVFYGQEQDMFQIYRITTKELGQGEHPHHQNILLPLAEISQCVDGANGPWTELPEFDVEDINSVGFPNTEQFEMEIYR